MSDAGIRRRRVRKGSVPSALLAPLPFRGGITREALFPALPLFERLPQDGAARGRGVTIAVLDSGFAWHPDLAGAPPRVLAHVDAGRPETSVRIFPGGRIDAWPEGPGDPDLRWHGTMVAAVAARTGALSQGRFRGVAPEARLLLVKVADSRLRVKEPAILRGLRWVLRHRSRFQIRVVNLSVGGDHPAPLARAPIDQVVEALTAAGVCVVSAAGNGTGRLVPPATAPSAITVGGFDDGNDEDPGTGRPWPSRAGTSPDGVPKPDLLAPSVWLPAPMLTDTRTAVEAALLERLLRARGPERRRQASLHADLLPPVLLRARGARFRSLLHRRLRELRLVDDRHQHVDGTSFAAPLVAGTVAQMMEVHPALRPAEVKALLLATARVHPALPAGSPRVLDPRAAVARARALLHSGPEPS
jgi:serine protease AprX